VNLIELGLGGLWAGLFACALGLLLTAPPRQTTSLFFCGVAGRVVRDVLMEWGVLQSWSTVVACAVIVVVAVALIRTHVVSPVVLVSSVLPLGAASAVFQTIVGIMRMSSLEGAALGAASAALSADISRAFTTTLAIAFGLGIGMALVRLVRGEAVWD
jgi:uncharacterized membrane protein YjjB (DUF3815 family)